MQVGCLEGDSSEHGEERNDSGKKAKPTPGTEYCRELLGDRCTSVSRPKHRKTMYFSSHPSLAAGYPCGALTPQASACPTRGQQEWQVHRRTLSGVLEQGLSGRDGRGTRAPHPGGPPATPGVSPLSWILSTTPRIQGPHNGGARLEV